MPSFKKTLSKITELRKEKDLAYEDENYFLHQSKEIIRIDAKTIMDIIINPVRRFPVDFMGYWNDVQKSYSLYLIEKDSEKPRLLLRFDATHCQTKTRERIFGHAKRYDNTDKHKQLMQLVTKPNIVPGGYFNF